AQNQDSALPRRQMLDRDHERELDRLLLHDHCFRTRVIRGDRSKEPIRVWLQPRQVGRGQRWAPWVGGRGHLRREHPRPAPLEQVEAGVRRDSVEPCTKRRAALEATEASPLAQGRRPNNTPYSVTI